MDKERKVRARQQAIACIELTKGFTWDSTTAWGRSIQSINDLSNHVIALTQDVAEEALQRSLNGM